MLIIGIDSMETDEQRRLFKTNSKRYKGRDRTRAVTSCVRCDGLFTTR